MLVREDGRRKVCVGEGALDAHIIGVHARVSVLEVEGVRVWGGGGEGVL